MQALVFDWKPDDDSVYFDENSSDKSSKSSHDLSESRNSIRSNYSIESDIENPINHTTSPTKKMLIYENYSKKNLLG